MNLKTRSFEKELLDEEDIPAEDLYRNLYELEIINKYLGGHAITLSGFKKLLEKRKKITVCEIGCGGGDNLLAINNFCSKKGIKAKLIGIDLKQDCIDFALKQTNTHNNFHFVCSDFNKAELPHKPDIIFSSLFCHHFTNPELVAQLKWMQQNSAVGFFINDLHRHFLAYYAIKLLTSLFSNSYLVKNDAPLSVSRGFVKKELNELCLKAGITDAEIRWKWAFRYLLIYKHA